MAGRLGSEVACQLGDLGRQTGRGGAAGLVRDVEGGGGLAGWLGWCAGMIRVVETVISPKRCVYGL